VDIETVVLCREDLRLLKEHGSMLMAVGGTGEWIRIRFVDVEDLDAIDAAGESEGELNPDGNALLQCPNRAWAYEYMGP
jgi:hypothetical protein